MRLHPRSAGILQNAIRAQNPRNDIAMVQDLDIAQPGGGLAPGPMIFRWMGPQNYCVIGKGPGQIGQGMGKAMKNLADEINPMLDRRLVRRCFDAAALSLRLDPEILAQKVIEAAEIRIDQ